MNLFEYDDYKQYVNDWISSRPKRGRGQLLKISEYLRIHSTLASHIFRGDKELSNEQAIELSNYLGHDELAEEYFLVLVQLRRAGSDKLKRSLIKQKEKIQEKTLKIVNRIRHQKVLSEEDKAIFYSNWYYSAIRLVTSFKPIQSAEDLYQLFNLPPLLIDQVLDFLVSRHLCQFDGKTYSLGPSITHLENTSPHIVRHHANWRLKAMERHPLIEKEELVFSAPLSISKADAKVFREKLIKVIGELRDTVEKSAPEQLMILNLDWVQLLGD